jgi:hypothetical protein
MAGTRKQVRKQLVTLLDADSTFSLVIGYKPTVLQSVTTKVLAVYTRRTRHGWPSAALNNNFYTFSLDCLVKRDDETSEDALDDMHEAVRSVMRANVGDSTWSALDLDEESDASFTEISGVPYRLERHTLVVKVTA